MKILSNANNQTVFEREDGVRILVSYRTPVAAYVPDVGYVTSEKTYSMTTSRHISSFCGTPRKNVDTCPQGYFDSLMEGGSSHVLAGKETLETAPIGDDGEEI